MLAALLALLPAAARAAVPSLQGHKPLRSPIVLIHGATTAGSHLVLGPLDLGDYFAEISGFLSGAGTVVKTAQLSTDGTIEERAAVLKNFLETDPELKGKMVNVIGHSLGGLDARWCVSVLRTTQIRSITTVGTPHMGTPLADWAVSQIDNNGLWYWFFRALGYDMASRRFLREITTSSMQRFNEKVPNSYDVRYFSVRTRARFVEGTLSALLWFPTHWLEGQNHHLNGNGNDGMVPYDSQLWGSELQATGAELDHLAQMNHHEGRLMSQKEESLTMWQRIYENLEREGY